MTTTHCAGSPGTEPLGGHRRRITAFVPPQPECVRQVRRMVTAMLRHWELEHLAHDAQLLATELLTNAMRQADDGHPIRFTLAHDQRWLSIDVRDRAPGVPRAREASTDQEGGRGLLLVQHIAGSWLCRPHPDGTKTVSCRLPL
jgi:anti-sigma regulatory factor (Ser/Thr protein kinase)